MWIDYICAYIINPMTTINKIIQNMSNTELCEFMDVFKLNNKHSIISNPSVVTYKTGDVYKGEISLSSSLPNGYGEIYYANGDVFATKWANNLANGWGIYIYANGTEIRGKWKNGIQNCVKGSIKFSNGDFYKGQLYNNTIWGFGTLWIKDIKEIYNGEFVNGIKNGYGISYWDNDISYYGFWTNNTFNGYGILYTRDKIYNGLWINGTQQENGQIIIL